MSQKSEKTKMIEQLTISRVRRCDAKPERFRFSQELELKSKTGTIPMLPQSEGTHILSGASRDTRPNRQSSSTANESSFGGGAST